MNDILYFEKKLKVCVIIDSPPNEVRNDIIQSFIVREMSKVLISLQPFVSSNKPRKKLVSIGTSMLSVFDKKNMILLNV